MLEHPETTALVSTKNALETKMENEQATPAEIGYLAGLYDGEGCIAIQQQCKNGKRFNVCVNVKITNSDMNIIEAVQSILLKLGVNPLIRERGNPENPNWKAWFEVYLTKRSHIKRVLEVVLPYLRGKRARAIVMLRFIDNHIDGDDAFMSMKELNRKGKSSEAIRETPMSLTLDEDMVHAT